MRKTLCVLFLVAGCADSGNGGDADVVSVDLAHARDMARGPVHDMATAPDDLTPDDGGADDSGTDDGGTTPDMTTVPPVDMAMMLPVDMAMMPPVDMAKMPSPDLTMVMMPADMVMLPPADMAGMKPADMVMIPPADMATMLPADMVMLPPGDMAGGKPADMVMVPPADMTLPGDGGVACHIVINEFQTGGTSASDEFIELYNPCPSAIDVTGYKLVYRAGSNTNPVTGADSSTVGSFMGMFGPGSYFVSCGTPFTGMCDFVYGNGVMSGTSGSLGLRDKNGTLIDSVAYGPVNAMNAFIETMPTVAPAPSNSDARLPNGVDTNDNSKDFKETMTTTPDKANK